MEFLTVEKNLQEIREVWSYLAGKNAVSYFLSPGWIEAWLTELPNPSRVHLALIRRSGLPVLAFFTGQALRRRSRFFSVRQLLLNASGNSEYDRLWIEYNNILHDPDFRMEFGEILQSIPMRWEEFILPGMERRTYARTVLDLQEPFVFIIDSIVPSPYVDLEKVRSNGNDYLALLSANTRYSIRRSLRGLQECGPLETDVPENLQQALAILNELIRLHRQTWQERGETGAFSSNLFCRFHRRLIESRFDSGEIQVLRIRAGADTVGCLYNFVLNGRVYFYQSGFNYTLGRKIQPGLASHFAAVTHNAALGHRRYDFLGGNERYKGSLSTDSDELVWGRIQRQSIKLNLEKLLQRTYADFRMQMEGMTRQ